MFFAEPSKLEEDELIKQLKTSNLMAVGFGSQQGSFQAL